MEMLDYVESRSTKTLEVLRHDYDDLHERAHKLVVILLGGGSATGAYALAKVGSSPAIAWAPVAALALVWLGTAAVLAMFGMRGKDVRAGNDPDNLTEYFAAKMTDGMSAEEALVATRRAELSLEQGRINTYRAACNERAEPLDLAYKFAYGWAPSGAVAVAVICASCGWY